MGVNWKGLLGGIAPVLAKALVNPGAGAAAAVGALSKALLGHEHATEPEIAAAIAGATPEQIAKIQDAEREFSLKLIDSAVALERIEADDRSNARKREIDTHDWTPRTIAIAIMVAFFSLLAMMLTREIPRANERAFDIMLGMLASGVTTVLTYYFGSSSSGRAKDAVIGRIANTK
jgi:hypothetical protein